MLCNKSCDIELANEHTYIKFWLVLAHIEKATEGFWNDMTGTLRIEPDEEFPHHRFEYRRWLPV